MSYVHCSACARAYNTSRDRACPTCVGEAAVIAAYEAFAKAIAAASPDQVGAAFTTIAAKAPPAPIAPETRAIVVPPRRDSLATTIASRVRSLLRRYSVSMMMK